MTAAKKAIVIGAGLSGLSGAYRLQQQGWQVKVLEASQRLGGRVQTDEKNGYLIDTGASAMATSYTSYTRLAKELGLADNIINTSPIVGIPRNGKVHELNTTKMLSNGISSTLFSWPAKLRMAKLILDVLKSKSMLDYNDMGKAAPLDTESARDYALRVLSNELNDYLCDPLARVMIIADGDKASKVELFSAIANIFGTRLQALQGGVNAFAQAIGQHLSIQLGCKATQVKEHSDYVTVTWQTESGETVSEVADACVVSCELPTARQICEDYQALLGPLDDAIEYTAALTVAIGTTVRPKTDAFVLAMPAVESPEVALLFMDHNKSIDRVPAGKFMINSHWETTASTKNLDTADDVLIERTLAVITKLFPEVDDHVDMTHVARWSRALPMTSTGAYQAIDRFNRAINTKARVQFAADYMSAAGQNTAVAFGERAANNLQQNLG